MVLSSSPRVFVQEFRFFECSSGSRQGSPGRFVTGLFFVSSFRFCSLLFFFILHLFKAHLTGTWLFNVVNTRAAFTYSVSFREAPVTLSPSLRLVQLCLNNDTVTACTSLRIRTPNVCCTRLRREMLHNSPLLPI